MRRKTTGSYIKMIERFSVSNFKSIKDEAVLSFLPNKKIKNDFDNRLICKVNNDTGLLKLGIVYGYNASGKSNLIAAIQNLKQITTSGSQVRTGIPIYEPFMLDGSSKSVPTHLSISFYVHGIRFLYDISYDSTAVLNEELHYWPEHSKRRIFCRTYDATKDISAVLFGADCRLSAKEKIMLKANLLSNNSMIYVYQKTNVKSDILDAAAGFFRSSLMETITPNKSLSAFGYEQLKDNADETAFYIDLLKKADFQITGIEPKEEMPKEGSIYAALNQKLGINRPVIDLIFNHTTEHGDYKLSMAQESNGTLRYFGFTAVLKELIESQRVLFVDELDSSLHPTLISFLLTLFLMNSGTSQLFFSTHNTLLMEADFIRDDMMWLCKKNQNGESSYRPISNFGIHKNNNIMRFYLSGRLGAVPNLGSAIIREEIDT